MSSEYELLRSKWEARQGVPVLTTVNSDGVPNCIYFSIGDFFDDQTFFIADNFFSKTRENILSGSLASVLFLTPDRDSFQFKGSICLQDSGPVFDAMKYINPLSLPGRAAAVIQVDRIYSGAKRLL